MKIIELTTKEEMLRSYDVLIHMYPDMSQQYFVDFLDKRINENYRMLAVIDADKYVASSGFWLGQRLYCDNFLQLDNMVVLPKYRSKKVGKLIVDKVKEIAKNEDCKRILIDTYVDNYDAHRFFLREGFIIRGYHLNYMV